jgi:hypothetical protein
VLYLSIVACYRRTDCVVNQRVRPELYIVIISDTIIEYQIKCFFYLRRSDENRLINYLTMYYVLKMTEEEIDCTKTGRTNCNLKQSWNSVIRKVLAEVDIGYCIGIKWWWCLPPPPPPLLLLLLF